MEKIKVVFTGGGTGGHVYPNIAIYETLKEAYPGASFLYVGTRKGAESRIVKNIPQPIDFREVWSKGIPQNIRSLKTLIALFYIFIGAVQSYFILRRFKPDIIVGSGGYVAAPVLLAASMLKLKVFIHEQNAVPGRLNRAVARFATRVGVSFSSTAAYFPEDKVMVTGYPLRQAIRIKKDDDVDIKAKYKIPEKNKVIFIFGGSGGAKTINTSVAELVPMLMGMDDLTLILATGRGYSKEYKAYEDTVRILENNGVPSDIEGRLIIREYFDNIDEIYSIADLVISRAGAGTIKEITTMGLPSILIPKINLPGDHQILNAREVQRIGGASIVYESVKLIDNQRTIFVPETALLEEIKKTLDDGDTLFNMRKNLRQLEKKNSTDLILNELEQILKGREKSEAEQLKIFYLQSEESEKNIELVFDSTTVGNSTWSDVYLELGEEDVEVEIKTLDKGEKIILRRKRGLVRVDGDDITHWCEINEDSHLELGNRVFVLKSYLEKVEKVQLEKSTTANILGSSFGIMVSRFGGLIREVVIGFYFGTSRATDIFSVGLTIANFMRRIVAENALENAFLPIFSRLFHRTSRKKTWEAASSIINFTLLLSALFTLLGFILAPLLINYLFPGLEAKGQSQDAIAMARIMMPYLFLVTVSAVMGTYLKAFNRFGLAEGASIFFSVGTVAGIVLFYSLAGLHSLAYGVLLGGLMQVLFMFPFLSRLLRMKTLQYTHKPIIDFDSSINKKYYSQLGPISLDVIFSKAAEVVGKALASKLPTGCISYLHYSMTIYRLPFAIISQAINTVILKEFSDQIAVFDKNRAKRLFVDGIKTNIFLLTPISILMIILAEPVVSILLQRGSFDADSVYHTARALKFYSIGLIGWGIQALTSRIFSARMDIKTSMVLNLFMLLVNVGLCFLLVNTPLGYAGLALATSAAFLSFAIIRVVVLKRKLGREGIMVSGGELVPPVLKTLTAALFMTISLVSARLIFGRIDFNSQLMGNLVNVISLSFIGISIYLLTSMMLKNTELLMFRRVKRFKASRVPVSMLSPFGFLDKVSRAVDQYKEDFFYKIDIYLSSPGWEVRNVGIKLIGLFKDKGKADYLYNLLKAGKENGFIRRNALHSLGRLNVWNSDIKKLLMELLKDGYFEVRVAALNYLTQGSTVKDYDSYRDLVHRRMKKATIEEQLAFMRLIARVGDIGELPRLERYFLSGNSLIREELLQLLHGFYRRKLLSADEVRGYIKKILITSNNMEPEFKLKAIIKKIYKEIE